MGQPARASSVVTAPANRPRRRAKRQPRRQPSPSSFDQDGLGCASRRPGPATRRRRRRRRAGSPPSGRGRSAGEDLCRLAEGRQDAGRSPGGRLPERASSRIGPSGPTHRRGPGTRASRRRKTSRVQGRVADEDGLQPPRLRTGARRRRGGTAARSTAWAGVLARLGRRAQTWGPNIFHQRQAGVLGVQPGGRRAG